MRLFLTLLMSLPFITSLSAQDEILDPPINDFIRYTEPVTETKRYLAPKGEEIPDQFTLGMDIYVPTISMLHILILSPELLIDELNQLNEIGQGQRREIYGWQKLNRYFNESYKLRLIMVPHIKEAADYYYHEVEGIPKEEIDGWMGDYLAPLNQLFWNRIMMFDRVIDSLLTLRHDTSTGIQTLQDLKQKVNAVLQDKLTGSKYTNVGGANENLVYQLFVTTFQESKARQLIERYNKGCRIDLSQIS